MVDVLINIWEKAKRFDFVDGVFGWFIFLEKGHIVGAKGVRNWGINVWSPVLRERCHLVLCRLDPFLLSRPKQYGDSCFFYYHALWNVMSKVDKLTKEIEERYDVQIFSSLFIVALTSFIFSDTVFWLPLRIIWSLCLQGSSYCNCAGQPWKRMRSIWSMSSLRMWGLKSRCTLSQSRCLPIYSLLQYLITRLKSIP